MICPVADEDRPQPSDAVGTAALVAGWSHRHREALLRSGLRQLALGGLAIAVTFAVGSLIGSHPG
jgi:VIT1/CCC1 family predicted Fe2+/Mn2+ transporter